MKLLKLKLNILKNNLNRIVLILCLLMTVCFTAHSQTTSTTTTTDSLITITSDQLRTANLIFAEHKKLTNLVPLLQKENHNLQLINQSWSRTDSIKTLQIQQKNQEIFNQQKRMDKMTKGIKIGGISTGICIAALIICLVLK